MKYVLLLLSGLFLMTANATSHWSYSNEIGPDYWGSLDTKFLTCASGLKQSPINIETTKLQAAKNKFSISYSADQKGELVNTGTTVRMDLKDKKSYLTFNGKKYYLLQMHFHTPSEHTIDGKHFSAVLHFVNKSKDDQFTALDVFMKIGEANVMLQHFLNTAPQSENDKTKSISLDLNSLLPKEINHFYNYSGSLTTPPCTEGLNWLILKKTISISEEQLRELKKLDNHNARPVQPLNDRKVFLD